MQFLKILAFCLITLISNLCFSQVNIESMRNEKESTLSGFLQGGLNYQKSNVDIIEINTSARIDYRLQNSNNKVFLLGSYNLGRQNNKDFKNELFSHLRFNFYPFGEQSVGLETFYQIQKDDFELLQIRQLLGTGFRIESNSSKSIKIAFGLGVMLDHEKIKNKRNQNIDIRSTNYLSFLHKTDNFNTFLVVYLQPVIYKPSDFRVLTEANSEIKITKVLSFNFTLSYRYDSETPESVVKNELKSVGSLKYDF